MSLTIRPATADDHEALLSQLWALNRYEQEIAGDRRTDFSGALDSLAEALDAASQRGGAVLLAELDGEMAGHLFMFFQMDDAYVRAELRGYAFISSLFVEAHLRGQGVGQALLARGKRLRRPMACGGCGFMRWREISGRGAFTRRPGFQSMGWR